MWPCDGNAGQPWRPCFFCCLIIVFAFARHIAAESWSAVSASTKHSDFVQVDTNYKFFERHIHITTPPFSSSPSRWWLGWKSPYVRQTEVGSTIPSSCRTIQLPNRVLSDIVWTYGLAKWPGSKMRRNSRKYDSLENFKPTAHDDERPSWWHIEGHAKCTSIIYQFVSSFVSY